MVEVPFYLSCLCLWQGCCHNKSAAMHTKVDCNKNAKKKRNDIPFFGLDISILFCFCCSGNPRHHRRSSLSFFPLIRGWQNAAGHRITGPRLPHAFVSPLQPMSYLAHRTWTNRIGSRVVLHSRRFVFWILTDICHCPSFPLESCLWFCSLRCHILKIRGPSRLDWLWFFHTRELEIHVLLPLWHHWSKGIKRNVGLVRQRSSISARMCDKPWNPKSTWGKFIPTNIAIFIFSIFAEARVGHLGAAYFVVWEYKHSHRWWIRPYLWWLDLVSWCLVWWTKTTEGTFVFRWISGSREFCHTHREPCMTGSTRSRCCSISSLRRIHDLPSIPTLGLPGKSSLLDRFLPSAFLTLKKPRSLVFWAVKEQEHS